MRGCAMARWREGAKARRRGCADARRGGCAEGWDAQRGGMRGGVGCAGAHHLEPVGRVAGDGRVDHCARWRHACAHCDVALPHAALREGRHHGLLRAQAARGEDDARRVPVQPVDHPGARAVAEEVGQRQEAALRRLLGKSRLGRLGAHRRRLAVAVEQRVDQRAARMAGRGVDHEPCVLVDGHLVRARVRVRNWARVRVGVRVRVTVRVRPPCARPRR